MSSFLDLTLVSLHLTALSLVANCSEYRTENRLRRQFYIAHEPTQYTVPLPPTQTPNWTFRQNEAKYIVFGINEKLSMRSGLLCVMIGHNGWRRVITGDEWWRFTTGENMWRRVRTGSNALQRAITGDNEWSRVITADDGVRQVTIGGNGIWTDDNEWRLSTSTTLYYIFFFNFFTRQRRVYQLVYIYLS